MKYQIGDIVSCNVEIFKNNKRKLSMTPLQKDSTIEVINFPIIAVDEFLKNYKIIIEPDMSGWIISKFHTKYQNIDEKFLGKKFYDIPESIIINSVKNKK